MIAPESEPNYILDAPNSNEIVQMLKCAAVTVAAMYRGAGLQLTPHSMGPTAVEAYDRLVRLVNDTLTDYHAMVDALPPNAELGSAEVWSTNKGMISCYCATREDGGYEIEITQQIAATAMDSE
jgi:hypothetical protein